MLNTPLMDTVWHRIDRELMRRDRKWGWLGDQLGVSAQTTHNWSKRRVPPNRYADIAHLLGWSVETLLGQAPVPADEGLVRSVSISSPTVVPSVRWAEMMGAKQLPKVFKVALPDDSMAPRAGIGSLVEFTRGLTPLAGDGVLVKDRAGVLYFREFRQGRQGVWEASAYNQTYKALDSAADGLEVVAVLTGISTRWGR